MVDAEQVRTALRTSWHAGHGEWVRLPGGSTSHAWRIGEHEGVVKAVPIVGRRRFEAGLAAAEWLAAAGMASGAPVRAADGALCVEVGGYAVALLVYVPGRPLDGEDPLDQQWWGDTLGAAHHALTGFNHPALSRFHRIRPEAAHLTVEEWIRPAVTAATEALARLSVTDQLSYGVLHGDPAPEAFRLDVDTGRTGLIDWASCMTGPLVYDVASAVMYAGGQAGGAELVDGYLSAGPVHRDELDAALPTLLRFRYAVQADHFARLVWTDDRTDGAEVAVHLDGLHRVRDLLGDAA